MRPSRVIEALLFASEGPLGAAELAGADPALNEDRHRNPAHFGAPCAAAERVTTRTDPREFADDGFCRPWRCFRENLELGRQQSPNGLVVQRGEHCEAGRDAVRRRPVADIRMHAHGPRTFDQLNADHLRPVEYAD